MSSSYKVAFLPMREGTRTRVWKEGFDQRVGRKQDGFKHQKIEWDIETERMEEKKFLDDDKKFEFLVLPTTRLEKKRKILERTYEKVEIKNRKKSIDKFRKQLSAENAVEIALKNQNEYEKNKARNYKTNIQFPTPLSTVRKRVFSGKCESRQQPAAGALRIKSGCREEPEYKFGKEENKFINRTLDLPADVLEKMKNLST
ncbi:uncharacterized protein LOC111696006 [Eurytemora carolleeae]|uniref:uncharacterized protein LOC111696006 n=1 Tax=Eurytemora carolleeae TaxID=1294199 RepID=UPI000C78CBC6|nr:uncharacterized protein LOC111696006 [Eurytemora carolleeae]|eukprot:XP_023321288.1 uncharacterized protein LOC111696006 [Eurytemora affinis]